MNRTKNKLKLLSKDIDYNLYLKVKWGTTIIIFLLLLIIPRVGIIISPIFTIIYIAIYNKIMLDDQINQKEKNLEMSAELFFKVFYLSFKKNRNIRKSIEETIEIVENDISSDFKKIINNSQNGININTSLKEYKENTSSITIKEIIELLIKYNTTGNNIDNLLNNKITELSKKNNRTKIIKYKTIPYKLVINCTIFTTIILVLIIIISKIY